MTAAPSLSIQDLRVSISGKEIVKGLDLQIKPGEVHALMGPNGSGKSTLCYALAGDPNFKAKGHVMLDGRDILPLDIDERSRAGLFLAYQNPPTVPGVNVANYLRTIYNAARAPKPSIPISDFEKLVKAEMARLRMDESFLERYLNEGFSGGERKRFEVLQMALLQPKYVLLDELDSGLDVDALRTLAEGVGRLRAERRFGVLVITHYARILQYLKPDFVHVIHKGRLVKSGGPEVAARIEKEGYAGLLGPDAEKTEQAAGAGEKR